MKEKTVSVISLGCFRNLYDSEVVINRFLKEGSRLAGSDERPHTLVINTCGFIKEAKEESIEVIKEALNAKKAGKIKELVVMGCLVERYRRQLEEFFPHVDKWAGIERFEPFYPRSLHLGYPHLGFLKICEGCLNRCSYCAIPLIKGTLLSRSEEDILREAKVMDRRGIREVNIIGQDITSWGRDLNPQKDLSRLLRILVKNTRNIRWFRLLYTHPRHISSSLIDTIAHEERICKYIDLPLQHINDRILRMMNRKTTKREIIALIKKIRKKIKGVVLRTSFIVGFPTETEEEFGELLSFVDDIKFERLGAFIYSREENTPAYNFKPQVHWRRRQARYRRLMFAQQAVSYNFNRSFIGKKLEVLVDKGGDGLYSGRPYFSAFDIDGVVMIKRKNMKPGRFYNVEICGADAYDLKAR